MTNKMTPDELHNVLDTVKEGDVVRAMIEGEASELKSDYPNQVGVEINGVILRHSNNVLISELIHVENLGQPEPPEPEVGSFALLDFGHYGFVVQHRKTLHGIDNHWFPTDTSVASFTWDEIKPQVKVLYHPDGTVNEGWKR